MEDEGEREERVNKGRTQFCIPYFLLQFQFLQQTLRMIGGARWLDLGG